MIVTRGPDSNAWRLIVGLGVLLGASAAVAQARKPAPKVIQLEEVQIEGRIQKPNAFYILNRSNLDYEVMELRTSFVERIVDAVRDAPFR